MRCNVDEILLLSLRLNGVLHLALLDTLGPFDGRNIGHGAYDRPEPAVICDDRECMLQNLSQSSEDTQTTPVVKHLRKESTCVGSFPLRVKYPCSPLEF